MLINHKKFTVTLFSCTVLMVSGTVWSGKAERDKQAELEPLVKTTQTEVKQACGCDVAIKVNWNSYDNVNHMLRIRNTLEAFSATSKDQCNSAANKKAYCDNMKSLEISFAKEVKDPEYNKGVIKASNSENTYTPEHMFRKIINKW